MICGFCGVQTADGGPCGRDECPGEATRARTTFGAPPPPRQPASWKRTAGLRLAPAGVKEITVDKPSCVALTQHPPEVIEYQKRLAAELLGQPDPADAARWRDEARSYERWRKSPRGRWTLACRWFRERWVGMWARIAQFMGVDLE